MKFFHVVAASLLACLCPLAATLTISVSDPVLEGTSLVITCITSGGGAGSVMLHQNGQDSMVSGEVQSNISVRVFDLGAVDRSNSGTRYRCVDTYDNSMSAELTLDVQWLPSFSLSVPSGSVQQYLEGSSQVVTVQELDLGKPPAPGVEWSVNRDGLTSGGGVTVSDASISFNDVRRSHSGEYRAVVGSVHGNVTADFTVDVTYPPTLGDTPPEVQLQLGDMFVFNCTPIPGNPVELNITFRKDGSPITPGGSVTVEGPLLTIPSVQRSDSGNYSCTVSNTVGMTAVYHSLAVVVPPGRPENLTFPSIGPYSVTVTWDPPTDDGGTPDLLNYMVALTITSDGQSVSTNQTTQTQLTFTALSHSENYTVSVGAVNSLGQQGPSAVGTVRTRDIPPVIGTVTAEALSLSDVQVTVTLSDTGGQPVEEYTVTISGTVMTFSGSADLQFTGNVTGLSLMNGVTYTVSVVARNSIGASQTFNGMVTASFVVQDLSPADTVNTAVVAGVVVAVVIVILILILGIFVIVLVCMKRRDAKAMRKPENEGSGDADYNEMVDTRSTDPLAPQYVDPSTLERQAPPPVVTYKKDEDAAAVQPAPAASGVVYADLDFSKQQAFGSKKSEKKKTEPIEAVVYSEVRLMTPQEKQQKQGRWEGEVGGDGEEPHSPTTIM